MNIIATDAGFLYTNYPSSNGSHFKVDEKQMFHQQLTVPYIITFF